MHVFALILSSDDSLTPQWRPLKERGSQSDRIRSDRRLAPDLDLPVLAEEQALADQRGFTLAWQ
jgi:hypothetical protein